MSEELAGLVDLGETPPAAREREARALAARVLRLLEAGYPRSEGYLVTRFDVAARHDAPSTLRLHFVSVLRGPVWGFQVLAIPTSPELGSLLVRVQSTSRLAQLRASVATVLALVPAVAVPIALYRADLSQRPEVGAGDLVGLAVAAVVTWFLSGLLLWGAAALLTGPAAALLLPRARRAAQAVELAAAVRHELERAGFVVR